MTDLSSRWRKWRKKKGRNAFTLVELLVSIAVLSILLILLVSIANQASSAWQLGLGSNARRSDGRMLLDFIARELEPATLAPRGYLSEAYPNSSQANSVPNLQFVVNVSTALNTTFDPTFIPSADLNPHALFWQSPIASSTSLGNLAEIGYFVKWDTTSNPGVAKGQLCRFFASPAASASVANPNYLIYNIASANPVNWLAATTITAVAPATAPSFEGWFADNVIALWIRCLDDAGNPIGNSGNKYIYDSRTTYTDSSGVVHPAPALPSVVELAIVTVDPATAAHIHSPIVAAPAHATDPTQFYTDLDTLMNGLPAAVKPGAQLFTTRVKLVNE